MSVGLFWSQTRCVLRSFCPSTPFLSRWAGLDPAGPSPRWPCHVWAAPLSVTATTLAPPHNGLRYLFSSPGKKPGDSGQGRRVPWTLGGGPDLWREAQLPSGRDPRGISGYSKGAPGHFGEHSKFLSVQGLPSCVGLSSLVPACPLLGPRGPGPGKSLPERPDPWNPSTPCLLPLLGPPPHLKPFYPPTPTQAECFHCLCQYLTCSVFFLLSP